MSRLFSFGIVAMSLLPAVAAATAQPGHLDLTFGSEGKRIVGASLPAGSARGPATVLEGPGGALYVVGYVDRADATSAIAIARLSADGEIDSGFGSDGLVEYLPPGLEAAYAYNATFDPQGRLVVVGQAVAGAGHTLVCRFDADGAVDDTFGKPATPGCLVEVLGAQDWANDVLVQTCPEQEQCVDGTRILTAGTRADAESMRRGVVAAFRADGLGLTAFGTLGLAHVTDDMSSFPNELVSIAQNDTGALVAGGWREFEPTDFDFSILRLRPQGMPEIDFDEDGYNIAAFDIPDSPLFLRDAATSVHLGDDGGVWVAGYAQLDALSYRPALVKLDVDGYGSTEFDGAITHGQGELSYQLCGPPCDARFTDMSVLPDGRILLTGNIARGDVEDLDLAGKNNTMAMRLLPDGTPDPSFGSPGSGHDGLAVIDHGPPIGNSDDVGTSLLLQDDKLVIAGYARATDPDQTDDVFDYYDFSLTRIGALDTLFGDGFE